MQIVDCASSFSDHQVFIGTKADSQVVANLDLFERYVVEAARDTPMTTISATHAEPCMDRG
jgi:hypothetical protein